MQPERLAYREALSQGDWGRAIQIRREFPETLGAPPEDVCDEIAALATDPLEPGWMIVEWVVEKNACKKGCRPYTLKSIASQFDHLYADASLEEARRWFQGYVKNAREHAPGKGQVGQTLFLMRVDAITPITDFNGTVVD